jgi:luciferase-like monooxygenase
MAVRGAQQRVVAAVSRWAEVEIRPHRYGGLEFRLGRRELGHIHGDRLVDIPFPKGVRDDVVRAGEAEPHHVLPNSGWVSVFLDTDEDVERAIGLLERSFSLALARLARCAPDLPNTVRP